MNRPVSYIIYSQTGSYEEVGEFTVQNECDAVWVFENVIDEVRDLMRKGRFCVRTPNMKNYNVALRFPAIHSPRGELVRHFLVTWNSI